MKSNAAPIYVESHIDASIEAIWKHTQTPDVHKRWDVRFTDIDYLAKPAAGCPQQFVYGTQVLPGLVVDGRGETLGERHRSDGTAYSGLKFWSDRRLSLIKEGAGYWRYVPAPDGGTRFLTRYDYRVRWGRLGTFVDRRLFRPLFGWGTAWSFDRLRLWLERGISPERSLRQTQAHALSVLSLALVFLYQGLVSRLLLANDGASQIVEASPIIGSAEVVFACAIVRFWRYRWPFLITLGLMPVLATAAAIGPDRALYAAPFNPVSFNLAVGALAAIALLTRHDLPSGKTPLRTPDRQRPRDSEAAIDIDEPNKPMQRQETLA